ncbi:MAG: 30S ribosome-binding factor RbfA [Saprospiraceae bacterium]
MESKRQLQLGETIKRDFSIVLQQEGPNIYGNEVLVSVTAVNMSPDLGIAKIYISIFNTNNKQEVLVLIDESLHRLKQRLYQRIRKRVRRVPQIDLYIDDTLDEMDHLNKLFDDMNKG